MSRDDNDDQRKSRAGNGHGITVGGLLVLAFAVRYWFNFVADHANNYGAADASEYMRNAQALFQIINLPTSMWSECWQVLINQASAATVEHVRSALSPLSDFRISGPIFPLFIAITWAINGGHADLLNWGAPLFAQTIVSTLTVALIAGIGGLVYSRPTGYLAGFIAALYPAFIVNSGRLYTETFGAFLLSGIIYLTVRGLVREEGIVRASSSSFLNGLTAATLQFTRSALFIVSLALIPMQWLQYGWRKGSIALIAFVIGFAAVAAPWLALQKLAFGNATLILDRVGNYNFFTGNNVDTEGWLSFPYPDGRGVDQKTVPTLAKEAITKNPRRWFQLMEDKPLRLFKFPWNDFRTAIGVFDFRTQVAFHEWVMLLSFIGATLGLASSATRRTPDFGYERPGKQPKDPTTARLFLMFIFAIHLAYLLFITVPRYNLTVMPVLIVLAAAGVTAVIRLFMGRGGAVAGSAIIFTALLLFLAGDLDITSAFATAFGVKAIVWGFVFKQGLMALSLLGLTVALWLGISTSSPRNPFETRRHHSVAIGSGIALACATLMLPIIVFPANANGRWYEWKAPFDTPGQLITQRIHLSSADWKSIGNRALYLLIDADGANTLRSAQLQVNGKPVALATLPCIALHEDFDRLHSSRGVQMREGEWIYSCMTESVPMRNSDLRQWFLVPLTGIDRNRDLTLSLRKTTAHDKGTIYGAYPTGGTSRRIPSLHIASWEKAFYGVENPAGLTDPRYDMKIKASSFVDATDDLSTERGLQSGSYNIRLLVAPPEAKQPMILALQNPDATAALGTNSMDAPIAEHKFGSVGIPGRQARLFASNEVPAYNKNDLWLIRVSGESRRSGGEEDVRLSLAALCKGEPYSSPWTPTIKSTTDQTPFDFYIPLRPSALPGLRKLQLKVRSMGSLENITDITNLTMQIYKTTINPISAGSQVY